MVCKKDGWRVSVIPLSLQNCKTRLVAWKKEVHSKLLFFIRNPWDCVSAFLNTLMEQLASTWTWLVSTCSCWSRYFWQISKSPLHFVLEQGPTNLTLQSKQWNRFSRPQKTGQGYSWTQLRMFETWKGGAESTCDLVRCRLLLQCKGADWLHFYFHQ